MNILLSLSFFPPLFVHMHTTGWGKVSFEGLVYHHTFN